MLPVNGSEGIFEEGNEEGTEIDTEEDTEDETGTGSEAQEEISEDENGELAAPGTEASFRENTETIGGTETEAGGEARIETGDEAETEADKAAGGSPMSVLAVAFSKAVQKVHPENTLPIKVLSPVSIRKVMGNKNSLLHQVVHAQYSFATADLEKKEDAELNADYRAFLKGFSSEQNIRMLSGVYRGICEGYTKAFAYGALDKITMEQRGKTGTSIAISYLGTLSTGVYGNRIRMTAFHAMPEKGIMLQMTEVGDTFYIDWYQGFHDAAYIRALRDALAEMGMKGLCIDRVE